MRTAITTATVVALLATGAGSAAARPADTPTGPSAAGIRADGLRWQAKAAYYLHHGDVVTSPNAQDVARGVYPGMRHAPAVTKVVTSPDAQDVARGVYPGMASVRAVEVGGSGFDWADAGIGAGLATALLLSAAGASALRRQRPVTR